MNSFRLLASATIGVAAGVSWLACVASGCHGRSNTGTLAAPAASSSVAHSHPSDNDVTRPHVAEINLAEGLPEVYRSGLLGTQGRHSFLDLGQMLNDLVDGDDKRVKGVLVNFGLARLGYARTQELTDTLAKIRAAGLPVICHADEYNNSTFWIASSGCDRVWVSPAGSIETVGISAQVLYARRLLGDLMVDVDMLQVGRFKGAMEPFTRDGPSDEARDSLLTVLRSIRKSWLAGVARRLPNGSDPTVLEQGPYSPEEAQERGLVDGIGYVADARNDCKQRARVDQVVARFGPGSKSLDESPLVGIVRILSGAGSGDDAPHITVLRAVGSISMNSSGSILDESDEISERRMAHELERVAHDESTRALILRIDSPGGSALASDLIWRRLMDLRKTRPVIVSIGDMAASGGYYLASAGSKVFAEPTSIVGSIGVVGGKFAFGRGLERVGIHAETFSASDAPGAKERAAYASPFASWDASTRERMLATMKGVYDLFIRRVAEGRGLSIDKVEQFAEGRIFSGEDGLGLGLVDEVGGLQKAIDHARAVAGLDEDAPVHVVGQDGGLLKLLAGEDTEGARTGRTFLTPENMLLSSLQKAAPDLLGFARAFSPIGAGEHALVAVPFVFLVR